MHDEVEIGRKGNPQADGVERWLAPAREAVERSIRAGMGLYRRERQLPGLIAVDPLSLGDSSVAAAEMILARLRRALRAERRRAKAGHWTYDLNRHIALRQAYAAEAARLAGMRRQGLRGFDRCRPASRDNASSSSGEGIARDPRRQG